MSHAQVIASCSCSVNCRLKTPIPLQTMCCGRAVMYFTLPIDKRKSVLLGRQLAAQKSIELGRVPRTGPAPGGAIAAARAARDSLAFDPPAANGLANGACCGKRAWCDQRAWRSPAARVEAREPVLSWARPCVHGRRCTLLRSLECGGNSGAGLLGTHQNTHRWARQRFAHAAPRTPSFLGSLGSSSLPSTTWRWACGGAFRAAHSFVDTSTGAWHACLCCCMPGAKLSQGSNVPFIMARVLVTRPVAHV